VNKRQRERFYDKEIAPELLRLAKACEGNGLSFLAVVEWAPNETGRTVSIREGSGFGIRMTDAAAQANGNIDAFMIPMQRHAHQHGHSSIVMHALGVPLKPGEPR
jgi:hypothetical protein